MSWSPGPLVLLALDTAGLGSSCVPLAPRLPCAPWGDLGTFRVRCSSALGVLFGVGALYPGCADGREDEQPAPSLCPWPGIAHRSAGKNWR